MTTTDAFKDYNLVIYVSNSDNKMSIPLENAKGNICNVINFITYVFMNSGMQWQDIYVELSNIVHHKIHDIEFEHNLDNKETILKTIMERRDEC